MKAASLRPSLTLLCLTAAASSAFAAPDQPGLGGVLQRQIEKQLPQVNPLPAPGPEPVPAEEPRADQGDVQVPVKRFSVEGAHSISAAEIQDVLTPWIDRTLSMVELQDAADAVAKLYSRYGLLAKTSFPPQKIMSDGVVVLQVVEAKLGHIKVEAEEADVRMNKEVAASYITTGNLSGELVNTKSIEEAVALLGELPGVGIRTELRPGDSDGEVDLYVGLTDKALVSGSLTASNYGNYSTGTAQGLVNTNINNATGYGDLISLSGMHTQGLWFGKVGWNIPVGVSGLKLGLDYTSMNYKTVGSSAGNDGRSDGYGINLTYPILRSTTTNLNTSLSYDTKSYTNNHTADGQTSSLLVSDYGVKDLTLTLSGNHYDAIGLGGVTSFSVGVTEGHWSSNTWNDSNSPNNYGQYTNPNFRKLNFSINRNQQILEDETILSATVAGQFSSANLDPVEKFYLGGANGVRAYPSSQGSGDEGIMLNVQLQHQLDAGLIGYAFYDYGQVRQYKDSNTYSIMVPANTTNAANQYSLSGAGLGARYAIQNMDFNGSVAWPIGNNPLYTYNSSAQAYVQQNNDGKSKQPYIWLQATYKF